MTVNDLTVEVQRKRIRNLHLRVRAPDGAVRVSLPLRANDAIVHDLVLARWQWIRKHQERLRAIGAPERQQFLNGEEHFLWGLPYRLTVLPSGSRIRVLSAEDDAITLAAPEHATVLQRRRAVGRWYRRQLEGAVPELMSKWQPILGVRASEWRLGDMKTRWGTCNVRAKRIWLSTELAKRPPAALEYVVVHELVHLLERSHNARFWRLVGEALPDWRAQREALRQPTTASLPNALLLR